jgi:N-acetyl-anhydromuramyl-L-alanine amidase AmpD
LFLTTYYKSHTIEKPKFIILHCCNFSHPSFKKEHPYVLWQQMNVGAHYIVWTSGTVTRCVPYTKAGGLFMVRHAGASNWKSFARTDHEKGFLTLNYEALGIEIDSAGFVDPLNGADQKGSYSVSQVKAVRHLVTQLQKRFDIRDVYVLGHSDVSPYRVVEGQVVLGKNDPSEAFPFWFSMPKRIALSFEDKKDLKGFIKKNLERIGYDLNRDGIVSAEQDHLALKFCLLAFCRRYATEYVSWCKVWDGKDTFGIPLILLRKLKGVSCRDKI